MKNHRSDQRRIRRPVQGTKNADGNQAPVSRTSPPVTLPPEMAVPGSPPPDRLSIRPPTPEEMEDPSARRRNGRTRLAVIALMLAVLAVCCVWLGSVTGTAAGQTVTDLTIPSRHGETEILIPATVTTPAGTTTPMGLVVMCHGFTGNRAGDGHFAPLASLLAQQGIASIAVDFPGCGDSTEPYTAYTMDNIRADIDAAIAYMQNTYPIRDGGVGLVGHSMGGRAVSLRLGEDIAAAALWSPANNEGLDGIEFLDHDPAGRQALLDRARQEGSVFLSGWNVEVSCDWLEQMAVSSPWQQIRDYRGPVLVAFAGGDPELLSQQTIDGTMQALSDRGEYFVSLYGQFFNATHNFTAMSGDAAEDAEIRARLEQATAQFFADRLG